MKIKVQDLTNEQLDYWAARAQGWEYCESEEHGMIYHSWVAEKGEFIITCERYCPTTNDAQAMALAKRYGLHVHFHSNCAFFGTWHKGSTVNIAICRAVIVSRLGEEVEGE